MYALNDNIVALATAPGPSALSVVRCSGPNVLSYLKKLLSVRRLMSSKTASLRTIINPKTKEVLDRAVVVFFKGPKSFTGQDVVEFSLHGGSVISKKVIASLVSLGCREASPGEFTYRAFINGKIDLIQAEAINSIIQTNKEINAFYALKNIDGFLSRSLIKIQKKLINLITYIEHELDFTEEEIEHLSIKNYLIKTQKIIDLAEQISTSSFVGSEQKTDLEISIIGKPNAGKSSLFNLLVGQERSIVTRVSGTTRDFISSSFAIGGIVVDFVDTAGIRSSVNKIEKRGIQKTFERIALSDIVLFVSTKNPIEEFKSLNIKTNQRQKIIFIHNKTDISGTIKNKSVFNISCKKNAGINKLQTKLSTLIKTQKDSFYSKNKYLISNRAKKGLSLFSSLLEKSSLDLKNSKDLVVFVSSLYAALEAISDSINPINKEDIINSIFKGFCVGK